MLGNGGLGKRKESDDVACDAAGMGDKKLYDLEANGVSQGLEHGDKTLFFLAFDVEAAAGVRYSGRLRKFHTLLFIVFLR